MPKNTKRRKPKRDNAADTTEFDWEAFVQETLDTEDEGQTTEEIAEKVGRSAVWVRNKMLGPLKKQGRLVVGKRKGLGVHNCVVWFPVYQLLKEASKKKKKR